ncbi:MAG TPA: hypothetical protein VFZ28_19260, partial [Burkholderiaceae bacterium]|nr:hypothetical protein [Burkholderiaceae bacterium]
VFSGLSIEENIRIGGQFLSKSALGARAEALYTLDGGHIGFCGTVAAMHENDALRRAYFGLH